MIDDYLLQGPAEGEFFGEGGQESHETYVDEQVPDVICFKEPFGKSRSGIFHGAEVLLQPSQASREDDAAVEVRQEVDSGYGTDHDNDSQKVKRAIHLSIHTEPSEGTMIVTPKIRTEDRRQEESAHRLQELEPLETGCSLTTSEGEHPDAHRQERRDRHDGEPCENLNERILFHAAKVLQKLHICKFFNKLFAYMRKKLYLCTRKG